MCFNGTQHCVSFFNVQKSFQLLFISPGFGGWNCRLFEKLVFFLVIFPISLPVLPVPVSLSVLPVPVLVIPPALAVIFAVPPAFAVIPLLVILLLVIYLLVICLLVIHLLVTLAILLLVILLLVIVTPVVKMLATIMSRMAAIVEDAAKFDLDRFVADLQ